MWCEVCEKKLKQLPSDNIQKQIRKFLFTIGFEKINEIIYDGDIFFCDECDIVKIILTTRKKREIQ